jgi:ribosome-interacting GTPase 1
VSDERLALSLDGLLADIWSQLALVKIYTKKRGQPPDLTDPICMRKGSTIEVGLAAAVVVFAFDQGG